MSSPRLATVTDPRPEDEASAAALLAVWRAGRDFAAKQAARDKARDELLERIRVASAAGHQTKDLIEASGLARQTVFDALKKPAGQTSQDRPEVTSYP